MRVSAIAGVFLTIICPAVLAANDPISGLDPVLYSESGWLWGSFYEPVSVIEFSDDSIILDIQPGDDDGAYPGLVNGGIGTNYGSDRFGNLDFDHNLYQVEVPLKILDDNEAAQFRIAVSDSDGTDGVRDEFYYHVNTFDYEIDEWDTFVRPLTEYDAFWSNGGDGVMNFGNNTVQLMTMWDTADALNVEIGGIYITQIDPSPPDATIFELNANTFGQAWTWGSYDDDGAIVYTDDSIVINAESRGDDAGAQGGLGHGLLQSEFDAEAAELVVTAKLLPDNEATSFLIEIRDNDELSGIFADGVEDLEWSAEQYTYEILTDEFSEDEFTEFHLPMTDYSTTGQAEGDVNFEGDFEQNFGMYMVHIMSPWGPAETLNIEIESIRIESTDVVIPGDYNDDGQLDAADIDLQAVEMNKDPADQNLALFDHNGDGVLDVGQAGPNESQWGDRLIWIRNLRGTRVGDVNFDNVFDSGDLVLALSESKYGSGETATWVQGDWNGDMLFDSGDLVLAFQDGGYVAGATPAVNSVPEPSSLVLLLGLAVWPFGRRRLLSRAQTRAL